MHEMTVNTLSLLQKISILELFLMDHVKVMMLNVQFWFRNG